MGRGAGGRAATRGTREIPELRVDHGVPAFEAYTPSFLALCESLVATNVLKRSSSDAYGNLNSSGDFSAEDASTAPARYAGADGLGVSALSDALLRGGDLSASPLARTCFGTMVSGVEATAEGWALTSKKGERLGLFDWLVVTSTGVAHPRWRTTFGGEPPLVAAAASMHDSALNASLEALAPLASKPVVACLLAYSGEAAAAWARVPFFKATATNDEDDKDDAPPPLDKIVVQRISPELTAVVLHSTHEFALSASHVYGATSTAARLAGATSDTATEAQVLQTMLDAASARLSKVLDVDAAKIAQPAWGPHLHRWGAAFPDQPLLPEDFALVPSAKVAFSGDFVDGGDGRSGSVEGAALSGMRTAEALQRALEKEVRYKL